MSFGNEIKTLSNNQILHSLLDYNVFYYLTPLVSRIIEYFNEK